jgi:transcriptional regulator with XRE-family HTH domain
LASSARRLRRPQAAFVEFKPALGKTLQSLRKTRELSQVEVARRLQSSQSRVARMEASDPGVSVDVLVRSLFRLGARPDDIAKALPRFAVCEQSGIAPLPED